MGEYDRAFIMRNARKIKGMTQSELADGICDVVTLARYESGIVQPTSDKYVQIMQRLGFNEDLFIYDIQTSYLYIEQELQSIVNLFEQREFQKAQEKIKKIREKQIIPQGYKENQQYLGRIELAIQYQNNDIGAEQYIEGLRELLDLRDEEEDSLVATNKLFYSATELLILNNLATVYGEKGDFETAFNIFQDLVEHFEQEICRHDDRSWYMIFLNYANLLGRNGEYDASIEMCWKGINWLKEKNKAHFLFNFYYNIGWNYLQKYKKKEKNTRYLKIAKLFVWQAFQLCQIYWEYEEIPNLIQTCYDEIRNLDRDM